MKLLPCLFAALVPMGVGAAEPAIAEMDRLAKASHKRDGAYELKAAQSFFSNGAALRSCVPPDGPSPEPFVIYLEILPDGRLGRSLYVPMTETAICLKEATANQVYPKPSETYVAEIKFSIK